MIFFLEKKLITFSCTYWPFSFCKIFKKSFGPIQSYEDVPFLGPKWPICHEQFFFVQILGKIINILLIYLLAPFIVQNFKKILPANPVMRMHNFWAQNGPFPPNEIFFQKNLLMSLLSFINAYLHAKNQSLILIY